MGMIKVDPNQKSTVIVLIVILLGAMVATVVRCLPGPQAKPKPKQAQQQSAPTVSSAVSVSEADYQPDRNPFQQPVFVKDKITQAVDKLTGMSEKDIMAMINAQNKSANPWADQGRVEIEPMQIPPVGGSESASADLQPNANEIEVRELPEFALLATVSNGEGLCAVIRCSDSKPKVVEVGDVVEGFKVTELDLDQAVLSDGRDTIVAKRPKA